ncbi:MAG: hypothetical protein GY944_17740 [bacterium]|nr:hypothetical protein [bacterium]
MSDDVSALRARLTRLCFDEVDDALDEISSRIEACGGAGLGRADADAIYRAFHGIKSTSASFGFEDIASLGETVETWLDPIREGDSADRPEVIERIAKTVALLRDWLETVPKDLPFDAARVALLIQEIGAGPQADVSPVQDAADAVLVAREQLGRIAEHASALDTVRARLDCPANDEAVAEGLLEVESHTRALRALLQEIDPEMGAGLFDAQVLRVGGQRVVVPLACVIEAIRLEPAALVQVPDSGEMVRLQSRLLPVARLEAVVSEVASGEGCYFAVLESEGRRVALVVDAFDEQQTVALEAHAPAEDETSVICGAVLLADGPPVRALDVHALIDARLAGRLPGESTGSSHRTQPKAPTAGGWKRWVPRISSIEETKQYGRYQ